MDSASVIAKVMLNHISPKGFGELFLDSMFRAKYLSLFIDDGDALSSSAYETVMLGTVTILLVDGMFSYPVSFSVC